MLGENGFEPSVPLTGWEVPQRTKKPSRTSQPLNWNTLAGSSPYARSR